VIQKAVQELLLIAAAEVIAFAAGAYVQVTYNENRPVCFDLLIPDISIRFL
jgi:hypothetical protein